MLSRRATLAAPFLLTAVSRSARAEAVTVRDDLAARFTAAGTVGTFVCRDLATGASVVVGRARAETAFLPASTFKIANALIALECGVVEDADHPTFPWDGVVRDIAAWNRDHTLRTAFPASMVPVFQEIARRIGTERMARYVTAFDYGNRDIGDAIDTFWLRGRLRISAVEQTLFLEKLWRDAQPVAPRAQAIVKDIMRIEEAGGRRLLGKTGAAADVGWFVGLVDRGGAAHAFALNLELKSPDLLPARLAIAGALLAELEVFRT